jgi:K+-sensing histidine kinase KdpD
LLLRAESGDFNLVASTSSNSTSLTLINRSPVLHWLRVNRGVIEFSDFDNVPQLQAMTKEEKSELTKRDIELMVPLKTKKDELFGLLLIGKKLSQQHYTEEDKQLVANVTDLVAMELENARLYNIEKTIRKELEKQETQRTEFLHTVAHELKTPLTAVLSSSELMADDSLVPDNMKPKLINNIFRSALMMDRRVTELLDLAKLQIGNLKVDMEPVDMGTILGNVTSQMQVLFQNKNQHFKMEILNSLPEINADRAKLEQVVYNLLSNANKFSPFESEIILRANKKDGQLIIEVEDSAEVIPEDDRGKLFDPYFRSEDSLKKDRYPGLGLGLAISRRLVELHSGEIWWSEAKSGTGNIFSFSIPE